jgi:hypothetical protein
MTNDKPDVAALTDSVHCEMCCCDVGLPCPACENLQSLVRRALRAVEVRMRERAEREALNWEDDYGRGAKKIMKAIRALPLETEEP